MIEVILRFQALDSQGVMDEHELCNTIRRTAHAIEGEGMLRPGSSGPILDQYLKTIGLWSLT